VCSGRGRHLVVVQIDSHSADAALQVREAVLSSRMAGVILSPPVSDQLAVLDTLDALNVPYVRIAPDVQPERSASVRMDDRAAAAEMTRMLLDEGHRRIGFIRTASGHAAASHRHDGFMEAMGQAGVVVDPECVYQGENTVASGMQATIALLALAHPPSAIFAGNDDMAFGALMAAYANGLQVPGGLSVVGFDDTPLAESVHPPLTTVRQPVADMARLAALCLLEAHDEAAMNAHVEYTIVRRGSSGPLPVAAE